MTSISLDMAEKFLASARTAPPRRGNLILAIDATASRERVWDGSIQLTAQMCQEAATIGTLSTQLVYYRGVRGMGGVCRASSWVDDPMALVPFLSKIKCDAGNTQIELVLAHVGKETLQRRINALAFVGDCCEEHRDDLAKGTALLAQLGVPAFMFQEGVDRKAQLIFQEIARLTKGAYLQFNPGMLSLLADLLRAVSVFAVGGLIALERQGSSASKLLLGQMKQ